MGCLLTCSYIDVLSLGSTFCMEFPFTKYEAVFKSILQTGMCKCTLKLKISSCMFAGGSVSEPGVILLLGLSCKRSQFRRGIS